MNPENIRSVIEYVLELEANHYEECLESGLDVSNHIYAIALEAQRDLDGV